MLFHCFLGDMKPERPRVKGKFNEFFKNVDGGFKGAGKKMCSSRGIYKEVSTAGAIYENS